MRKKARQNKYGSYADGIRTSGAPCARTRANKKCFWRSDIMRPGLQRAGACYSGIEGSDDVSPRPKASPVASDLEPPPPIARPEPTKPSAAFSFAWRSHGVLLGPPEPVVGHSTTPRSHANRTRSRKSCPEPTRNPRKPCKTAPKPAETAESPPVTPR